MNEGAQFHDEEKRSMKRVSVGHNGDAQGALVQSVDPPLAGGSNAPTEPEGVPKMVWEANDTTDASEVLREEPAALTGGENTAGTGIRVPYRDIASTDWANLGEDPGTSIEELKHMDIAMRTCVSRPMHLTIASVRCV